MDYTDIVCMVSWTLILAGCNQQQEQEKSATQNDTVQPIEVEGVRQTARIQYGFGCRGIKESE